MYGADPYKGDEDARPWLVLSNHEGQPFHGEQNIALSLTTRTWMEKSIEIDEDDWTYGGTPDDSRIVPWAIQSIDRDDIDDWQGRLVDELVNVAIDSFVGYLRDRSNLTGKTRTLIPVGAFPKYCPRSLSTR